MLGLSAALPDVVPREQVVTMNSIASAVGAVGASVPTSCWCRAPCSAPDAGAALVIFLVIVPLLIALVRWPRFSDH